MLLRIILILATLALFTGSLAITGDSRLALLDLLNTYVFILAITLLTKKDKHNV